MRSWFPFFCLPLCAAGLLSLPAPAMTAPATTAPVKATRTASGFLMATAPNGQVFLVKENHAAPLAIVNTWFQVGGRNELPADEGISHFLEHMLFDGTTKRTVEEFNTFIFSNGLSRNASTSYDWTNYFLQGPAERFSAMAGMHAEMLMGPALLDSEFAREREVVKEELRRAQDNPPSWLFRQQINATWSHANYDHQVLGTMESLDGQSNQQMRDYFAKYYGPNNAITIAIGDFDEEVVMAELQMLFKVWKRRELPPVPPVGKDPQTAPQYVTLEGAFESTSQMLTFKAPPYAAAETYAADLALSILGQGESSRLVRRLRDELGLVASIEASNYSKVDGSTWYVSWQLLDPAKATEATNAILEVLARFRQEGPSAEELALAKRQIAVAKVMEGENLLSAARSLGSVAQAIGVDGAETYLDRIHGVTVQDVQWVAQQFFQSDKATLGIIGPAGTAQPTPTWSKLDARFTPLVAPRDLGRLGQSPIASLNALAASLPADPQEELYTLSNGLTVHLRPSAANPTVALSLSIKGGMQWESWDTNGLAQLTMNSLLAGTEHRSKAQISRELDQLGGGFSVAAGRDELSVRGLVLASDYKQGLDLLHDVVTAPTFPADEVAQERAQQLQAIAAGRDDMLSATLDQLRFAMYGADSTYGRPAKGRESTVGAFTESDCRQFHARVMNPANTVIAVAGLFDPAQMKQSLEATFGGWTRSASAGTLPESWQVQPAPTMPEGTARIVNLKDKAQSVIAVGLPGVGLTDPDLPRLQVLHAILGSSSQSRLFRSLRGKEGLAYSTYSMLTPGQGTGTLAAYIATRPEKYEQAVTGMRREMQALATEGPTAQEVADALVYLAGQTAQSHQGHAALANFAATNLARGLPVDYEWQQLAAIQQVTLEETKAIAAKYLQLENHWLAVSGPLYQSAPVLD